MHGTYQPDFDADFIRDAFENEGGYGGSGLREHLLGLLEQLIAQVTNAIATAVAEVAQTLVHAAIDAIRAWFTR
jgi:hypothetical protein